jgi:hypothetical protein
MTLDRLLRIGQIYTRALNRARTEFVLATVRCPVCGADYDLPCIGAGRKPMLALHADRRQAATTENSRDPEAYAHFKAELIHVFMDEELAEMWSQPRALVAKISDRVTQPAQSSRDAPICIEDPEEREERQTLFISISQKIP